MSKKVLPEEQSEAELEAAFRKVVDDAVTWAKTEGKRDQVTRLSDLCGG
jgi:hypothetical protein